MRLLLQYINLFKEWCHNILLTTTYVIQQNLITLGWYKDYPRVIKWMVISGGKIRSDLHISVSSRGSNSEMAANGEEVVQRSCETPGCDKDAKLQCPTCIKLAIPGSFFCSQVCSYMNFFFSWEMSIELIRISLIKCTSCWKQGDLQVD